MKDINQIILELDDYINCLIDIKTDLHSLFSSSEQPSQKAVTLEEVRTVLAEKSRLGFTKEIKKLLLDFGVSKLSEIKESDYATLLQKAEELGNE